MQVGIVGSGNIGSDLLLKLHRNEVLELRGVAGIDPASEGLERARELGYTATSDGLQGLLELEPDLELVFDATSAGAHAAHAEMLVTHGIASIDLTPAATGPAVVPSVNLSAHLGAPDVNLVTCGAQATVPMVAALSSAGNAQYAEIVSTIASRSAGPGTRANIDEFTVATAQSLEEIGGAAKGKAIIVLNPAEPPIIMRNTIYARLDDPDVGSVRSAVEECVADMQRFVPGYRLAREPLISDDRTVVFVEVEGAGDYLPSYAGNLDIMTSAAVRVAELREEHKIRA